jgi:hypothetical protein
VGAGALALLALFALRRKRWAYLAFVVLGLLYFPAQTHFHMHAPKCEQLLPTLQQIVPLLHNYAYIVLFAGFYWLSWVQFRDANMRSVWALVATLLAAALFEVADGMTVVAVAKTARHAKAVALPTHCRLQDLVPAAAGALGAALLLAIWSRLTRKPGYVRLVRRGAAAASRRTAAPPAAPPSPLSGLPTLPRAGVSARGVPTAPVPARGAVPPPPDFSPGPTPADAAPTEEVARKTAAAAHAAIVRRLQAILGRVRPMFRSLWAIIRGRRRAIVVGVVLLALVGAGAFLLFSRLSAPAPVVTAQAPAPEPPPAPPRPLQVEVEGYYEPSYKFTVSDRRFIRLTLRPEPSVTFARSGTKQEVGCADARIGSDAVRMRCALEAAGIVVTIDGRFASRYASNRLDMPVLSAWVTVTNTRGEVVYRARDSFYWHVPD